MTVLDWALVVVVLLAAVGGATQGFLASALGFLGFAAGAFAGVRLGPLLLPDGSEDANAPVVALVAATVLGIVLGGLMQQVGERLRRRLQDGRQRRIGVSLDAGLGAAFTVALVVGAAWLVSAIALQAPNLPSDWRSEIRRSTVLRELRRSLPPADDALALLARFDPLPGFSGPAVTVGSPDSTVLRGSGVRVGRRGVVRVEGTACGVGVVGSGWVVARGYVVTNQHVIAGEEDTTVIPEVGGERLRAFPVHVDAQQDIAILAVPDLTLDPLRVVRDPRRATPAALLGYPLAGPFRARSARIASRQSVSGEDAYGRGPVTRLVLPFRGLVEQGNSGGPLVDARGRVLGTVFASSTRAHQRGGYAVPNDVVNAAMTDVRPGRAVDPGPCSH